RLAVALIPLVGAWRFSPLDPVQELVDKDDDKGGLAPRPGGELLGVPLPHRLVVAFQDYRVRDRLAGLAVPLRLGVGPPGDLAAAELDEPALASGAVEGLGMVRHGVAPFSAAILCHEASAAGREST